MSQNCVKQIQVVFILENIGEMEAYETKLKRCNKMPRWFRNNSSVELGQNDLNETKKSELWRESVSFG